jgi:hypothetical protein
MKSTYVILRDCCYFLFLCADKPTNWFVVSCLLLHQSWFASPQTNLEMQTRVSPFVASALPRTLTAKPVPEL